MVSRLGRVVHHVAGWIASNGFRVIGARLRPTGLEHVPRTGGFILAFNHHSYVDFFVAGVPVLRYVKRLPYFMAKEELWKAPVLGFVLRQSQQIPVVRTSAERRNEAREHALRLLRAGEIVTLAPEQTISRSFDLLPFATGAVRMAQEAGVPIVPSVSWGSQRLATKGRRSKVAFGVPILVRYGPPISAAPDADPLAVTAELQASMTAMLDDLQREYPVKPRPGDDWWLPARLGGSAPDHETVLRDHLARQEAWREGRDTEREAS